MRALKWFAGLFTHNFWWKMLSLAVAVLIWFLVASEPEVSTFASARLEFKNLPDDLEISSDPVTTVSLELTGPAGELRGIGDGGQHPVVILDMAGLNPGQHTFPVGPENVKLSRGVYIVRAIPSVVRMDFELRQTRMVPVRVRFSGEGRNGYVVASASAEPPEMEITGPRSHVDRIDAVVTDPVDVSGLTGFAKVRMNTFVGDPFVRCETAPKVLVTLTMKKAPR